jgi:hypothetical protein
MSYKKHLIASMKGCVRLYAFAVSPPLRFCSQPTGPNGLILIIIIIIIIISLRGLDNGDACDCEGGDQGSELERLRSGEQQAELEI